MAENTANTKNKGPDKSQNLTNKMIVKISKTEEETILPSKLGRSGVLNLLKDCKMVMASDVITYKENHKEGHVTMEITGNHKITAETMAAIRSSGPQETKGPLKWAVTELKRSKIGVIKGIPQNEGATEVEKFIKSNNPNIAEVRRMGTSTVYTVKFLTNCLPQEVKTAYGTRSVHMYVKGQKQCQNCLKLGHDKKSCDQTEKVCTNCSSSSHLLADCTEPSKCTNCGQAHKSTSPECPVLQKEREKKTQKIISFAQIVKGNKTNNKEEEKKQDEEEGIGQLANMIRQIVREEIKAYFDPTSKKDQETMTEPEPKLPNPKSNEKKVPDEKEKAKMPQDKKSPSRENSRSRKSKEVDARVIASEVRENLEQVITLQNESVISRAQSSPPVLRDLKNRTSRNTNKNKKKK